VVDDAGLAGAAAGAGGARGRGVEGILSEAGAVEQAGRGRIRNMPGRVLDRYTEAGISRRREPGGDRTRWGKEMEESGAAPVKSAPEWIRVPGWPVKIEEIPDGIPLPEEPARVPMWKR